MSEVDDSPTRAATPAATEQDLGPLAWVLDEVRKSLEAATKAVGRFVRDADAARQADLETLDTSALRIARQQLHQACGALEMVGFIAPAQVLRGMEAADDAEVIEAAPAAERVVLGRGLARRALLVGLDRAVRDHRDRMR